LRQALESLEFAILLFGLRVNDIHFLVHEGQERTFGSNDRELQHVSVAARGGAPATRGTGARGFGPLLGGPRGWRGGRRYRSRSRWVVPQSVDPPDPGRIMVVREWHRARYNKIRDVD
jgi:hypothetical protein